MKILSFIPNFLIGLIEVIKLFISFITLYPEKKIAKLLLQNGLTVATAESCTGGLISSRLTDVPGSSAFINENIVTYANEAKIKYLGVLKETLDVFGAVSEQTAKEMSKGLLEKTKCDIALSITGIAGPTGGSKEKPVGLVFIGLSNEEKTISMKFYAAKFLPRRIIKFVFSQAALVFLYKFLKDNYLKEV